MLDAEGSSSRAVFRLICKSNAERNPPHISPFARAKKRGRPAAFPSLHIIAGGSKEENKFEGKGTFRMGIILQAVPAHPIRWYLGMNRLLVNRGWNGGVWNMLHVALKTIASVWCLNLEVGFCSTAGFRVLWALGKQLECIMFFFVFRLLGPCLNENMQKVFKVDLDFHTIGCIESQHIKKNFETLSFGKK